MWDAGRQGGSVRDAMREGATERRERNKTKRNGKKKGGEDPERKGLMCGG